MKSVLTRRRLWYSILAAAGLAFVAFVYRQSVGEFETIFTDGPGSAKAALSVGDSVTIGLKTRPVRKTIVRKDGGGFITSEGDRILYQDLAFVRKVHGASVSYYQWSNIADPVSRLPSVVREGDVVDINLKPPPGIFVVVGSKDDAGIFAMDGRFVRYADIGYIKRRVPLIEAFPKRMAMDIVIVPAFLLFAFSELLAILLHRP
jgi:hypothetical protein